MLTFLVNHLGQITWGIVAIIFACLLVLTWRNTRKTKEIIETSDTAKMAKSQKIQE